MQGPFLRGGVPTGSIDTGASSSKPVVERDVFGGMPYAAYDECYHRLCDDIYNIHVPPRPRDSDPQKLLLGPKKYSLENIH